MGRLEGWGFKLRDKQITLSKVDVLEQLSGQLIDSLHKLGDDFQGMMILIDEADKPNPNAGLGYICKYLTEEFSKRQVNNICFALAGQSNLRNKLRSSHESSLRIFRIMTLQTLPIDEVREVVDTNLEIASDRDKKYSVSDEFIKTLFNLSNGYPHFVQQYCFHAFECDEDYHLDRDDILKAVKSEHGVLAQIGNSYFYPVIDPGVMAGQRNTLDCLVQLKMEWTNIDAILSHSKQSRQEVAGDLKYWIDRGIVIRHPEKFYLYRLASHSLNLWLAAQMSE